MKFIITESQLKRLMVEDGNNPKYSWVPSEPSNKSSTKTSDNLQSVTTYTQTIDSNPIAYCYTNKISADKCITEFCKTNRCRNLDEEFREITHNVLTVLSIATVFIPVVGPLISAGIQLADAGLYAAEGKGYDAGLTAGLAVIPVAGPILNKIPGLRQLGKKGLQNIFSKVLKNGPKTALSVTEKEILDALAKNSDFVVQQTNQNVKRIANVAANTVKDQTKKQILKNIVIKGKDLAIKGGKEIGKDYVTGAALDQTYNIVQSNTPKIIAQKYGVDWNNAKLAFGSSGTAQDNNLLKKALEKGWRPGTLVPKEFRTPTYVELIKKEQEDVSALETMISQSKQNSNTPIDVETNPDVESTPPDLESIPSN